MNTHSSEPLKLYQMFNNEKSTMLCGYGEFYISGLTKVRKKLLTKLQAMLNSIEFSMTDINLDDYLTFNHQDVMNLSIVEEKLQNFFSEKDLTKMLKKSKILDERNVMNSSEVRKKKEDDLLNFSHMGMSLLEVTDLNIDSKHLLGESSGDGLNAIGTTLDTERILGEVLQIPDESGLDLLSDINLEIKAKPRAKTMYGGNALAPAKFDFSNNMEFKKNRANKHARTTHVSGANTNMHRSRFNSDMNEAKAYRNLARSENPNINKYKRKSHDKPPPLTSTLHPNTINPNQAPTTMFGRAPSVKSGKHIHGGQTPNTNSAGQKRANKPPLFSKPHHQRMKSSKFISDNVSNSGSKKAKSRKKNYRGRDLHPDDNMSNASRGGYHSRHMTPDPSSVKNNQHHLLAPQAHSNLLSTDQLTRSELVVKNSERRSHAGEVGASGNGRTPLNFSAKSRSPRSSKGGSRKRRKYRGDRHGASSKHSAKTSKASLKISKSIKEMLIRKPTRETIPASYHPLLIKLIDGVGVSFDFSNSEMGDLGVHFISYYMTSLKGIDSLKMNNCKVTDTGVAILCHSLTKLKIDKLYLNQNMITLQGVQNLLDYVSQNPGIRLISLKKNKLERTSVTVLIKEFGNKKVTLLI